MFRFFFSFHTLSDARLPAAGNEPDYQTLPEDVRQGLTVHFVEEYRDMVPLIFDPPTTTA